MSVNCSASDPRDKVFAIVSLLEPHVRGRISIDYMASTHDVFAQAAMACITECMDLGILSFAQIESEDRCPDIPSFTMANFVSFLRHRVHKGSISKQFPTPDERRMQSSSTSKSHRREHLELDKYIATSLLTQFNALGGSTLHDAQCQNTSITHDSTRENRQLSKRIISIDVPNKPQAPRKAPGGRTIGSRTCDPWSYHTTVCGDVCTWMATISPGITLATQVGGSVPHAQLLPRLEVCARYLDVVYLGTLDIAAEDFLAQMETVRSPADPSTLPWLRNLWLDSRISFAAYNAFIRAAADDIARIVQNSPAGSLRVFSTKRGIGMTSSSFIACDAVYRIVSASGAFLLREVRPGIYRIVGKCYIWARMEARPPPWDFWCEFEGLITIY
jgi:hypothetical protein